MNHDPQLTLPGVVEPEQTTRIEFTISHEPVPWPRAGHRIMWPKAQKFTPSYMLKTVAALQAELDRLRRADSQESVCHDLHPKGAKRNIQSSRPSVRESSVLGRTA